MNPFQQETLRLILIFFVPGFISMKVYSLIVPSERLDFSKMLMDAVAFSCINFGLLYWPIVFIHTNLLPTTYPVLYYFCTLAILFVIPCVLPLIFVWFQTTSFYKDRFSDPHLKAWDKLFSQRKPFWVVVHLKDGSKIAGVYSTNSYTSTYPTEEQIYLEEEWEIEPTTLKFLKKKERSSGIIINKDQYQYLEFFQ